MFTQRQAKPRTVAGDGGRDATGPSGTISWPRRPDSFPPKLSAGPSNVFLLGVGIGSVLTAWRGGHGVHPLVRAPLVGPVIYEKTRKSLLFLCTENHYYGGLIQRARLYPIFIIFEIARHGIFATRSAFGRTEGQPAYSAAHPRRHSSVGISRVCPHIGCTSGMRKLEFGLAR